MNSQVLVQQALMGAASQMERALDDEISRLDTLELDDLETLRQRRLQQMKADADQRREWLRRGHGSLLTLASEQDFFTHVKDSQRVVALFYRQGSSRYSDQVLADMRSVAEAHLETMFVAVNAEKAPFLCDRWNIWCLPSIVLIKDAKVDKILVGLSEISPKGIFTSADFERTFYDHNFVHNMTIADKSNKKSHHYDSDSD